MDARAALGPLALLFAALCTPLAAPAADALDASALTLPSKTGDVHVDRYAIRGTQLRPAIVILHGASGIAPFAAAYVRYAQTLAASGFDTYLISYFDPHPVEKPTQADAAQRARWRTRIGTVVDYARRAPHASGQLGLLGFSLGGQVALADAAADPRVNAAVIFYARFPEDDPVRRLPPLLVIHGEADTTIPYASGKAIVARANALGGRASILGYRKKEHGFDFTGGPAAASAMQQTIAFFRRELR